MCQVQWSVAPLTPALTRAGVTSVQHVPLLVAPSPLSEPRAQAPDFPDLPDVCPFNYAVLALACMAPTPEDRPPFFQVRYTPELHCVADWTAVQFGGTPCSNRPAQASSLLLRGAAS